MSESDLLLSGDAERLYQFVNACANYVFFHRMAEKGAAAIFGPDEAPVEYYREKLDKTRDVICGMLDQMSDLSFVGFLEDHMLIAEIISGYMSSRQS